MNFDPVEVDLSAHMSREESADAAWQDFKRHNPLCNFESEAVALILADGLASYLSSAGIAALDRLGLFTTCPDLLPRDYADNGHVRDSNTLRDELRDEVRRMCEYLQERRYAA